jgi:hypothetical protein
VLEGLPVAAPQERSVMTAREATFAVFFREAPPIARRAGVPWPAALESAVRSYLAGQDVALPPAGPGPEPLRGPRL